MKIFPVETGSDGNLYLLKTIDNKYFLIECGIDSKKIRKYLFNRQMLITNIKGCFISHIHSDHIKSIDYVSKYVKIYCNNQVYDKYKNNATAIKPNQALTFTSLKVMPFEVEHGDCENYGYIFKDRESTILFATDFQTIIPNISNIQFTEIFIECNWTIDLMNKKLEETKNTQSYSKYERQFNTHCSLDTLKEILLHLDLSCCKKITLVHSSKDVCNKNMALNELNNFFPNIDICFNENEVL